MHLFAEYVFDDDYDYVPGARVLATGDTTGYAAHGDFSNGWPEGLLSKVINQGAACDVFGDIQQCAPLANSYGPRKTCPFSGPTANESIGDESNQPLEKLPGNNPLYGSEGSGRSKDYKESVGLKGGQAKDAKQDWIPTTVVRKAYFPGDPGFKAGGEIEQGGSDSAPAGGGVQANEKKEIAPMTDANEVAEDAPTPTPAPVPVPAPSTESAQEPRPEPAPEPAPVPAPVSSEQPAPSVYSTSALPSPPVDDAAAAPVTDATLAPPPAPPSPTAEAQASGSGRGGRGGWRGGRNRVVNAADGAGAGRPPVQPAKSCSTAASTLKRSIVTRSRRSRRAMV